MNCIIGLKLIIDIILIVTQGCVIFHGGILRNMHNCISSRNECGLSQLDEEVPPHVDSHDGKGPLQDQGG